MEKSDIMEQKIKFEDNAIKPLKFGRRYTFTDL